MPEIHGWRLTKTKYIDSALDGFGSGKYGGRWNHKGFPVAYCGTCASLTVLEVFVNTRTDKLRKVPYSILFFTLDVPNYLQVNKDDLPENWLQSAYPQFTKNFGTAWIKGAKTPVLYVPSAVVPQDYDLLVNPRHPDLQIKDWHSEEFRFDSRMF